MDVIALSWYGAGVCRTAKIRKAAAEEEARKAARIEEDRKRAVAEAEAARVAAIAAEAAAEVLKAQQRASGFFAVDPYFLLLSEGSAAAVMDLHQSHIIFYP